MVKKGSQENDLIEDPPANTQTPAMLTSKQEVADELKVSVRQLSRWLEKYPFERSGISGKILGRWRVLREDVWIWFRYIQKQEARHPEARKMRPEEPPAITEIQAR